MNFFTDDEFSAGQRVMFMCTWRPSGAQVEINFYFYRFRVSAICNVPFSKGNLLFFVINFNWKGVETGMANRAGLALCDD